MSTNKIIEILGDQSDFLLNHTCKTIDKSLLHIPSPNTIDEIWMSSDRNTRTLNSLQTILGHGRLANTGYVSILPVDQGVEHTAGASFAPNPLYFDPGNIIKLAIEGGCNAVASTFGVLGAVARKYAHRIPFIVKINPTDLPDSIRPNTIRNGGRSMEYGSRCGRCHNLLRLTGKSQTNTRSIRGICSCTRTRNGNHPLVLPS